MRRVSVVLLMLFSVSAFSYERKVLRSDLSISGKINPPSGVTLQYSLATWRLLAVGKNSEIVMSPETLPKVDALGNFEFSLKPRESDYWKPGQYCIALYVGGWLGASEPFALSDTDNVAKDVNIKLSIKCDRILKIRVVDHEKRQPLPGMKVSLALDSFANPALKGMELYDASAHDAQGYKTDGAGCIVATGLPDCDVKITTVWLPSIKRASAARPQGRFIVEPKFHTVSEEPVGDAIPVLFVTPADTVIFWDQIKDSHGNKCAPGDIVEFTRIGSGLGTADDGIRGVFQITANADGIFKSPPMPLGTYTIKSVKSALTIDDEFQTLLNGGFNQCLLKPRHTLDEELEPKK